MVAILGVGFVANLLVRPVAAKFHEDMSAHDAEVAGRARGRARPRTDESGSGGNSTVRLVLSWAVVELLLAYGVFQTVTTALKLFS